MAGAWSRGTAGTNKAIGYFPLEWRSHCHAILSGTIDERANIAHRLQSAKESVYLPHKVRVAYRRDNIKLRSRQKYKAVGTAPTALVFLSHSLYFTSKSITTSH